jgi:hypothetical protein
MADPERRTDDQYFGIPSQWTECCRSCEFLRPGPRDGCGLRKLEIDDPGESSCASHTSLTRKRDKAPLGPALRRRGASVELLDEATDTDRARRVAFDIVSEIAVVDATELDTRQRMALHLLERWRDRRASIHIDRVIEMITPRPGSAADRPSLPARILDKLSGTDLSNARDDRQLLERLTLPGRAVLFGSLLGGVVAFYVAFVLLYENLPSETAISIHHLFLIGVAVWAVLLFLGVRLLPLMGKSFLRDTGADSHED